MANISSTKDTTALEGEMVTKDTRDGTEIIVALKDGTIFGFKQFTNELYYFDTNEAANSDKTKTRVNDYSMFQTIKKKISIS